MWLLLVVCMLGLVWMAAFVRLNPRTRYVYLRD
jgi:hypothetical protein